MLSCEQCRKYLAFFLDQALGVKESLDVHEHLQECAECTDLAAAERTLRAVVRQKAAAAPLPEAEKRQLIRRAMRQNGHAWSWLAALREAVQWRDVGLGVAFAAAGFVQWRRRGAQVRARDGHDVSHLPGPERAHGGQNE